MAGSNPYLKYRNPIDKAKSSYKIRFMPGDRVVDIRPEDLPYGETGLGGSVLDIALHAGLDIDHACGGVAACSTCHVHIREGGETCNEPEDFELDLIDAAPANDSESRLACQCVPNGTKDLVVDIPSWNRNLVRE